ncbi:cation:proton antiporter [Rhizobium sp. LCM 4573]|uniref:cation:proton antiporter n=1 Tax=Rhizobium sp. LCM 4573 TaxID=1848291 RepID=UPI0008D8E1FB|nr:cation:proton antiporter [Rhizobium sp. LCM 4573]OHV75611.1 hypothetical protein LCM4573_15805 [Rhizobium sp. LCM 4573]
MSAPDTVLSVAISIGLVALGIAFLLTVYRVIKGPTLPDRVVALDMLVGIVIGFIGVIAIRTGFTLYIDIAISLGLVGFLATVAFARFILARGGDGSSEAAPAPAEAAASGSKTASKTAGRAGGRAKAKSASLAARKGRKA